MLKGIDSHVKLAYLSDSLADGGIPPFEIALILQVFIGTLLVVSLVQSTYHYF
jgi:hypothetical protein